MIVGVTGFSSQIGVEVCSKLVESGHTVVKIGRDKINSDRILNLEDMGSENIASGLDAIIHLAWVWDQNDLNLQAGERLATFAKEAGSIPVLLSTFSVYSAESQYGRAKKALESAFLNANGHVLRAGLIWGGEPAGIVATLKKLANLPLLLPLLFPEPKLHHSELRALASALVIAATSNSKPAIFNAASVETVSLNELLVKLSSSKKLLIPIPIGILGFVIYVADLFRVKLPFRSDSVLALKSVSAISRDSVKGAPGDNFPGTKAFFEWAAKLAK